jgi:hypothetical protein
MAIELLHREQRRRRKVWVVVGTCLLTYDGWCCPAKGLRSVNHGSRLRWLAAGRQRCVRELLPFVYPCATQKDRPTNVKQQTEQKNWTRPYDPGGRVISAWAERTRPHICCVSSVFCLPPSSRCFSKQAAMRHHDARDKSTSRRAPRAQISRERIPQQC